MSTYFPNIKKVDIDYPDKNSQQPAPDYFLKQLKIAIEVKTIIEQKRVERKLGSEEKRKKLQNALDEFRNIPNFPKGYYYLLYPDFFRIKKGKEKELARRIIEEVRKIDEVRKKEENWFSINVKLEGKTLSLQIKKSERIRKNRIHVLPICELSCYSFSQISEFLAARLQKLLPTADRQLGTIKAEKRILLLVNNYHLPLHEENFCFVLANVDMNNFRNIDEIWVQFNRRFKKLFSLKKTY